MLIKKVKVVASEGTDVSTEERYLLTADIDRMASLVGVPVNIARKAIKNALDNPNATYYGEARDAAYFRQQCNVWEGIAPHARKLELDNIHLRVSERIKTDASNAFLIVPLSVTNPGFVGELGSDYELIPHIVMETYTADDRFKVVSSVSLFRPFADGLIDREIKNVLNSPVLNSPIDFRLVGFDLLLQNELDRGQTVSGFNFPVHMHVDETHKPNRMVYDFGFGVTMEIEINVLENSAQLTCLRNGNKLRVPRIQPLDSIQGQLATAPHKLLTGLADGIIPECEGPEDFSEMMTAAVIRLAAESHTTSEDYAVLRWLIARINNGYTGIGWRN